MGYGSWNSVAYSSNACNNSYSTRSRSEIFTQRDINPEMDLTKSATHIRESRDSEEHPNSVPIIIALDETGSMGSVPEILIKDYFPKLMDSVIDSCGIKDPQIMFMGIGDHECDDCPCQVGQFEPETLTLDATLKKIYLEGRGGGNKGESYLLAWLIAANHTDIDSFNKRNQKGYLFTIGDEPTLPRISANVLKSLTGIKYEKDYTWQEAYEAACEKYNVYHIHINHGSDWHGKEVEKQMKEFLGDHFLVCKKEGIVETIVNCFDKMESPEIVAEIETLATENFNRRR